MLGELWECCGNAVGMLWECLASCGQPMVAVSSAFLGCLSWLQPPWGGYNLWLCFEWYRGWTSILVVGGNFHCREGITQRLPTLCARQRGVATYLPLIGNT